MIDLDAKLRRLAELELENSAPDFTFGFFQRKLAEQTQMSEKSRLEAELTALDQQLCDAKALFLIADDAELPAIEDKMSEIENKIDDLTNILVALEEDEHERASR